MKVEPQIYVLSGLGADERVFSRLKLALPYTFLPWIPELPNETLSNYAGRMAKNIKCECPILIGLSFGGIIAQEIAAQQHVHQLILISTVSKRNHIPWYFRFAGAVRLPKWLPSFVFSKSNFIVNWMFNMQSTRERSLLDEFIRTTPTAHIRWALQQIAQWKAAPSDTPFVHVHGNADRIFPARLVNKYVPLKAGHFSLFTQAEDATIVLNRILDEIPDCTF